MRDFILFGAFLTGLLTTGCDPYYPITITNKRADTTQILVKKTLRFGTDKQKLRTSAEGFDVYVLAPNEQITVGGAIANLAPNIPFDEIRIVKGADTVTANNLESIKKLFDQKTLGRLKKPYNISIK